MFDNLSGKLFKTTDKNLSVDCIIISTSLLTIKISFGPKRFLQRCLDRKLIDKYLIHNIYKYS